MAVRVLWVVKGLGPGGAERLLCAAARAHDPARFHVECAYVLPWKDHLAEELERAGVATHCLSRTRSDPRWPLRLFGLVREGDWDVVHVHSPLPGSVARLAARTVKRGHRPALATTEHNRWATHRAPTRWLNNLTSRLDDATFAVTDEVRASMSGPAARRAETLQHGIDVGVTSMATGARAQVRAELGIGDDEVVVGTVANFRPQKDYPNLLRAARLLADRHVPVRLVAVGQGPQEAEIRALHAELGLGDRVVLTGFRDDAVRVMGACDVFTMASQWEGLPVALMEALALGLPVVATDVGGIAEEMTDGVDALLVPPADPVALADALQRVVTDADLRAGLAAAARARATGFDVGRAVERIEAVYDGLARPDAADTRSDAAGPRPGAAAGTRPDAASAVPDHDVAAFAPPHAGDAVATGSGPPPARRRAAPSGLDIREATPDDRPAIIELCRASLGWGDDPRFEQLFAWKHDDNAFGPSYMWVATDGDRVVGLRAFMRWEFVRGGRVLRAVRAVDTATHPDFQGKGLFTAMTMHGLEQVRADGVDFVFNTPNAKSRPGYLKMGWQEVGKLPVAIKLAGPSAAMSVARSRVAASHWPLDLDVGESVDEVLARVAVAPRSTDDPRAIVTNRSADFVRWRYGAPWLGYRAVPLESMASMGEPVGSAGSADVMLVRARRRGSATELVLLDAFGGSPGVDAAGDSAAAAVIDGAGATHALRLGTANPRRGFVPYPGGGPMLTWRHSNEQAMPALANWQLTMGDIELF